MKVWILSRRDGLEGQAFLTWKRVIQRADDRSTEYWLSWGQLMQISCSLSLFIQKLRTIKRSWLNQLQNKYTTVVLYTKGSKPMELLTKRHCRGSYLRVLGGSEQALRKKIHQRLLNRKNFIKLRKLCDMNITGD